MADINQLKLLDEGVVVWNNWRKKNKKIEIDLSNANLSKIDLPRVNLSYANLSHANLSYANLNRANLSDAYLFEANLEVTNLEEANIARANLIHANLTTSNLINANLSHALLLKANIERSEMRRAKLIAADLSDANLIESDLSGANLSKSNLTRSFFLGALLVGADISKADLSQTNLIGADLSRANLSGAKLFRANLKDCICIEANFSEASLCQANLMLADLRKADLRSANLECTVLIHTKLDQAILTNSYVYGISAWDLKGTPKEQEGLIINSEYDSKITVDDIRIAQFIYLLLNRENLRNIFDTITSKAVLILGRFTPERKIILDAIAKELRRYNLVPIIFDFERPVSRDFTETIKTLAGISLFIIADITNPQSSPLELQATVPDYQIPFVPIIEAGEKSFSLLGDLIGKYDWVLDPVITYSSIEELSFGFKEAIIDRAWSKHQELQIKKTTTIKTQSIDDFVKTNQLKL